MVVEDTSCVRPRDWSRCVLIAEVGSKQLRMESSVRVVFTKLQPLLLNSVILRSTT